MPPSPSGAQAIATGQPRVGARHRALEDVQALVTGTLLAAMGLSLFKEAGLLAGGTAGLALLLGSATGWNLSLTFLLCNAPFYAFACLRMGFGFTSKTLAAVALAAVFLHFLPHAIRLAPVSLWAAAVLGGLLIGVGMLILFRHGATLGGFNVVAVYLQEKLGYSAGKVQLVMDALVLALGVLVSGAQPLTAASSLLGGVVLNLVLMVNHRPGRYQATP
jgi:uncharacterized membrane-anchored protein YitT (DUF2179 family)